MNKPQIPIAISGLGKIAFDQHIPSIATNGDLRLAATVSRSTSLIGIPNYHTMEEMCRAQPELAAIALCTPPQVRYETAQQALRAGLDVMLEKPPAATLGQIEALKSLAEHHGRVLFATWHSRFAPGVRGARAWLTDKNIRQGKVIWHEDVRRWHPGQSWLWEPGGLGVFDPGINALSILTEILPAPLHIHSARLEIPENCQTPIATQLEMRSMDGAVISADFDFRQTGPQIWTIKVMTDDGDLYLTEGGANLHIGGCTIPPGVSAGSEYEELYRRFVTLHHERISDVDTTPLLLVADAFLRGERITTEPFYD